MWRDCELIILLFYDRGFAPSFPPSLIISLLFLLLFTIYYYYYYLFITENLKIIIIVITPQYPNDGYDSETAIYTVDNPKIKT